ncbi:hypothetical protein [Aneurinibacillus tyrosinisolvens]|uniref:hypothetical protein n=1 Tax=Aneurinibacillus tyrosinisolvens TaxID=1443435 RepID=UPI00063FB216|nr:hypothetical protein [Aneurinibacillus tyrosinisolvens]
MKKTVLFGTFASVMLFSVPAFACDDHVSVPAPVPSTKTVTSYAPLANTAFGTMVEKIKTATQTVSSSPTSPVVTAAPLPAQMGSGNAPAPAPVVSSATDQPVPVAVKTIEGLVNTAKELQGVLTTYATTAATPESQTQISHIANIYINVLVNIQGTVEKSNLQVSQQQMDEWAKKLEEATALNKALLEKLQVQQQQTIETTATKTLLVVYSLKEEQSQKVEVLNEQGLNRDLLVQAYKISEISNKPLNEVILLIKTKGVGEAVKVLGVQPGQIKNNSIDISIVKSTILLPEKKTEPISVVSGAVKETDVTLTKVKLNEKVHEKVHEKNKNKNLFHESSHAVVIPVKTTENSKEMNNCIVNFFDYTKKENQGRKGNEPQGKIFG